MGVIKDMMIDRFNEKNKNSRWVFTAWQPPVCRKPELIQFMVWQRERTKESFQTHYQGYIEFYKPYSRTQVKNLFSQKSVHLEEPEQSRERNIMYCTKPDTYSGERSMYNGPSDVYYEFKPHKTVLTWHQVKDILDVEEED